MGIVAIAFAIATRTIAHMILENPRPYGLSTLNNSPLDGLGQDFPCKQRVGVYDLTSMNYWTAGEKQVIGFKGSAVHGGGSCQFSVSTDLQTSKSSQWKVIHSVIGGCPASVSGNLAPDQSASTFDLTLPVDMPTGEYTFAWTWFNRLGRREMYMNCAPITVISNGNNISFLDALPDMFVANLPNTVCATPEGFDYAFPEPGQSVTTATEAKLATSLIGTGCAETVRGLEATTARARTTTAPIPSSITLDRTSYSVECSEGGISSDYNAPSHTDSATRVPKLNTELSVSPSACTSCDKEGTIMCFDDGHFGVCSNGCADRQSVAAGTLCANGVIIKG